MLNNVYDTIYIYLYTIYYMVFAENFVVKKFVLLDLRVGAKGVYRPTDHARPQVLLLGCQPSGDQWHQPQGFR